MNSMTMMRFCQIANLFSVAAVLVFAFPAVHAQEEQLPDRFHFDGLDAPTLNEGPELRPAPRPELTRSDDEVDPDTARIIGSWNLVAYENIAQDGTATPRPYVGRIAYDSRGNMSAQLMPLDDNSDEPTRRYFAYFGKYSVDRETKTVTHAVEASNIRNWVDTNLVRDYSFDGENLVLEVRNDDKVATRLTWSRI